MYIAFCVFAFVLLCENDEFAFKNNKDFWGESESALTKEDLYPKDDEIEALIEARNEARKSKNWAEADRIRDELKAMGIEIKDTPNGVEWKKI